MSQVLIAAILKPFQLVSVPPSHSFSSGGAELCIVWRQPGHFSRQRTVS